LGGGENGTLVFLFQKSLVLTILFGIVIE
jgi:hypothetical protein